jgi:diguanylate cyclase (GGDEF)-like protein
MTPTWLISGLSAVAGFALAWWLFAFRPQTARQRQQTDALLAEARTDTLTGLKNRRSFDEELCRQFAQRQRQGIVFSLLLIDLDHFKLVNDTHGHPAGDLVLQTVAQLLTKTLREMDLIYRHGGDEFAVVCPGSKLHEALTAAERIRQAMCATPVPLLRNGVSLTLSVGVAEVDGSETADGLLQRADQALYAAKHAGKNRVRLHDGQFCISVHTR